MNTENTPFSTNARLRKLVEGSGLSQMDALALVNRKVGVRKISDSAWKSYFCAEGTSRYRNLSNELLELAEKVLMPLQKDA
ncbi:MAG: hypothetical protein EKK47_13610 [Burkholderiales bacterium]|nr:MAG: hypothetical protein EKK47_13610 [Burkholderiales bacterium]